MIQLPVNTMGIWFHLVKIWNRIWLGKANISSNQILILLQAFMIQKRQIVKLSQDPHRLVQANNLGSRKLKTMCQMLEHMTHISHLVIFLKTWLLVALTNGRPPKHQVLVPTKQMPRKTASWTDHHLVNITIHTYQLEDKRIHLHKFMMVISSHSAKM